MADATNTSVANTTARKARGRPFKPGNNANPAGRPKGSRNKIAESFIHAMSQDFEVHGELVIARVREEMPAAYLKLAADLVPKDINIEHNIDAMFLIALQNMAGR